MRRFVDTLPTLREGAPARPAAGTDGQRFDPGILARVLAQRAEADPASAPTSQAVARVLPFTPQAATAPAIGEAEPAASIDGGARRRSASPFPSFDETANTVADQIASAVAEARKEADKARTAAVAAARAEEKAAAAKALETAREDWCTNEAAALSTQFEAGFEALHARLSDAFGRALAPIAEQAIRDLAVRRFASVLDDLIGASADAPSLTVEGPPDLIAALRKIMGASSGVAFAEADAIELSVTVGDTRLDTTVGAWAETLAEAMGHERDVV
ncbi:hypothetical protein L1787_03390 [Acuticoccus sp. M5D2P5]|uniref:hypothetical protein n=1 Tax=Acuticoccus kalidii TaxID=2910977 RepID=UPI001F44DC50|nr:hypothetical protein [Acuticoccus kalidii]MCF3932458.1 hypothetical protein [Acuticoccus kalidii]